MVSWLKPASKLSGSAARMTSSARVAEVLADALGADDQVAVAEHDALRLAGAARGVEDRGDVEVDARSVRVARRRPIRSRSQAPSSTPYALAGIVVSLATHEHDVLEVPGSLRGRRCEQCQPVGRGDEDATRRSRAGCGRPAAARSSGFTGTKTPPAADAPKIAATVSIRLSR